MDRPRTAKAPALRVACGNCFATGTLTNLDRPGRSHLLGGGGETSGVKTRRR